MEESLQLATICEPRSKPPTEPHSKSPLIREWIAKFALNAGQALDATAIGIYLALWEEGFADLPYDVLEAAFKKTLRECKFWPIKVADIREHVAHAESNATNEAAEKAWEIVLDIRRRYWNPDIPGPFDREVAKLSDRVRQAARAAGVFRDFTAQEWESGALHTWAKKRFVESFIRYGEIEQEQFLLPDGEIKNLLTEFAKTKALPAATVSFEELHALMLTYPEVSQEEREDALRFSEELKKGLGLPSQKSELPKFTVRPSLRSLEEQKRILREKGFLPKEE